MNSQSARCIISSLRARPRMVQQEREGAQTIPGTMSVKMTIISASISCCHSISRSQNIPYKYMRKELKLRRYSLFIDVTNHEIVASYETCSHKFKPKKTRCAIRRVTSVRVHEQSKLVVVAPRGRVDTPVG
eukprot:2673074-Pleurochrysis_carterae.AAC.3